ncbi:hypothetical protein OH708_08330 [Pseudomonas capsici]|uniref:hypothetical protein n=1 Tax=Pseudomonas capsici TaxID=2810614 RepID=UPI0021F0EEEF|nr:hypothetical protein [Pseudomonas capsici]MCV4287909.1 hypothetical protein [Pseudomonas capsici]
MKKEAWLDDCRGWCKKIQFLAEELEWAEKPSHSGWTEATSLLFDERRVTIPHLYFKGEYVVGRMGERVTYALMYKEGKEKRRVFMLEVWPSHERSHKFKDGKVLFGPHIHLGDYRLEEVTRAVRSKISGATEQAWVQRFVRHARIRNGRGSLAAPFGNDLFGQ